MTTAASEFSSSLESLRQARGWSQATLARASGVSRAAVSAIEVGRLVPSTAAALKLARALGVTVEQLFQLGPAEAVHEWAWPAAPTSASAGTRVWQVALGGRHFLYPVEPTAAGTLPHDGVAHAGVAPGGGTQSSGAQGGVLPSGVAPSGVLRSGVPQGRGAQSSGAQGALARAAGAHGGPAAGGTPPRGSASRRGASTGDARVGAPQSEGPGEAGRGALAPGASLFTPVPSAFDPERTIVIAGCDPTMGMLAQVVGARSGMRVLPLVRSSREALELLGRGLVHAAGFHLPAAHDRLVKHTVGMGARIVHVVRWDAGVAVHPSRHARAIGPLLRGGVHWVNREEGSGARACLDRLIESHRRPVGYDRVVRDHRAVAATISSGWADAGICPRPVAEEAGLDFLPVQQEAYELCIAPASAQASASDAARIEALIDAVRSLAYRRLLADVPGYAATETGDMREVA